MFFIVFADGRNSKSQKAVSGQLEGLWCADLCRASLQRQQHCANFQQRHPDPDLLPWLQLQPPHARSDELRSQQVLSSRPQALLAARTAPGAAGCGGCQHRLLASRHRSTRPNLIIGLHGRVVLWLCFFLGSVVNGPPSSAYCDPVAAGSANYFIVDLFCAVQT